MAGWGQPHGVGAGTTGQIAEAHRALDMYRVPPGPLAMRVLVFASILDGQNGAKESSNAGVRSQVAEIVGAVDACIHTVRLFREELCRLGDACEPGAVAQALVRREGSTGHDNEPGRGEPIVHYVGGVPVQGFLCTKGHWHPDREDVNNCGRDPR